MSKMSLSGLVFSFDFTYNGRRKHWTYVNVERSPAANANICANSAGIIGVVRGVLTRNSRILGLLKSLDFSVLFSIT